MCWFVEQHLHNHTKCSGNSEGKQLSAHYRYYSLLGCSLVYMYQILQVYAILIYSENEGSRFLQNVNIYQTAQHFIPECHNVNIWHHKNPKIPYSWKYKFLCQVEHNVQWDGHSYVATTQMPWHSIPTAAQWDEYKSCKNFRFNLNANNTLQFYGYYGTLYNCR